MSLIIDNVKSEGLADIKSLRIQASLQAASASTINLTNTSETLLIFTPGVAGQIVNLPNATTLSVGHIYWIWNDDTNDIIINDFSGTILFTSTPTSRAFAVLKDNSTSAGVWGKVISSSSRFISSAGVLCGYNAAAVTGTFLEFNFTVASSDEPYLLTSAQRLAALSLSASLSSTGTVGVFYSDDLVNPLTTISLTAELTKVSQPNLQLISGKSLAVKVTSGTIQKPMLILYTSLI